ncbi:hypothetical protein NEMBOFW57_006994 [Staphylotrichum longicolle]|uniref:Major facilitator superfamily (MFS) profile domain-containing protein n=1 Tax=Staphylotrichum longicolle TaxID=669026 RepID=A0AAD4EXI7_9PEZI|nr:hypothetical protein NEMBOFW57_006994 [Staphylotrichum longicolle]
MVPSIASQQDAKLDVSHGEFAKTMQVSSEADKGIWQLLKENPRVIIITFFANCGSFLFGYDVLVQGAVTALPAFTMYFGSPFGQDMILPALWQGLWQAFAAMGIMTGAFSNGALQDRFGRKIMFFVGGSVSATVGQMIAISIVFSRVMDFTPMAFKLAFACQWVFAGFAMVVGVFIPESPVFLVAKDRISSAEKVMKLIYGSSGASTAERIQLIRATMEHETASAEQSNQASYSECFKGTNWRRTRIVALLNTLQQFIGVSLVSNSTYFFIMAGMSPNMSLTINQIGVGLSMACTLVSWVVIAHIGRRTAILTSFVAAGVIFLGMGIAGFWTTNNTAIRFVGVALIMAACCSNLGVGTAYPIVAAEIPSVTLRSKTLGLGFLVNAFMTWVFSFCVPYMFNADEGNLGGKIGLVFCGFCIIGFVLSWIDIPETRNVTYAQLDYLFQQGTPTRAFGKPMPAGGENQDD